MKIFFAASTYEHIRNFHLPYLREFKELGWRVHVGCANPPEGIPYVEKTFPLPFRKKILSFANLRAARMIRKIIVDEGYDFVSVHTSLASFFTRLALFSVPNRPMLVNTVHGYLFDSQTWFGKRLLFLCAEKMMANVTDLLMVMNQTDETIARRHGLGRRIVRIPGMGVNFSSFDEARFPQKALREELGVSPDAFVLIYPAEFSRRKNQKALIKVMSRLSENVLLLLPGDGALMKKCQAIANRSCFRDRILFPGYVADISKWYAVADAAVSASRSEGLPFHMMEAMYMRLPVIASAVKGHTDLITDGQTGLLYPYGDEKACAERIRRIQRCPSLGQLLAENARKGVERYELDRVLPLIMEQYEVLIAELRQSEKGTRLNGESIK